MTRSRALLVCSWLAAGILPLAILADTLIALGRRWEISSRLDLVTIGGALRAITISLDVLQTRSSRRLLAGIAQQVLLVGVMTVASCLVAEAAATIVYRTHPEIFHHDQDGTHLRQPGTQWIRPTMIRPVFSTWMAIAMLIGGVVSRIILAALFCLLFAPVGLFFRLVGRDALRLHKPQADTYWTPRPQPHDLRQCLRQS